MKILNKVNTANIICFLVLIILAVITFWVLKLQLTQYIGELITAWITFAASVIAYLFGKEAGKKQSEQSDTTPKPT